MNRDSRIDILTAELYQIFAEAHSKGMALINYSRGVEFLSAETYGIYYQKNEQLRKLDFGSYINIRNRLREQFSDHNNLNLRTRKK